MTIEKDIMQGEVFGTNEETPQNTDKPKTTKVRPKAKTMAEATAGLKTLDAKKKKSKAGVFAKGTHGSGAAKMRAGYKKRRQEKSAKKK